MTEVRARYINCCCCGGIICKALPGTESETHCKNCKATLYYLVGDNGVIVIPTKEPQKPWATMEIPKFAVHSGDYQ